MYIFQKTQQDEQKFQEFIQLAENTITSLEPYANYCNIEPLKKTKENFILKTNDFFRTDRKLNIGVIGQVKAGKSTFLNTLLFQGKEVLPSAATPKTAALTKIEYAEENCIMVEYYDEGEWEILESNAKIDSKEVEYEVAREIMAMVTKNKIVPLEYIRKKTESFFFETADSLLEKLNSYVGEDGMYTPVVKNVTIKMNKPELKDISIVDTPGLNDSIISRTDRTREFIEVCDVVFFLSRASQFLDQNDMQLLRSQLPQKGVNKIVMIGSRFDEGITDEIFDYSGVKETMKVTQKKLEAQARSAIERQNEELKNLKHVQLCEKPIFISAMCWNMCQKKQEEYSEREALCFNNLNEYDDVNDEVLKAIGNMDRVQELFHEIVEEKDNTLSKKAENFLPVVNVEWKGILNNLFLDAEKTLEILKTKDQATLEKEKKNMQTQITGIKGSIAVVFGELIEKMHKVKQSSMIQLRDASREYSKLVEKQGTDIQVFSYRVSDSKWYKPSTWGTGHKEYGFSESHYTYLDASDAIENIRQFSNEACTEIEKVFQQTVDLTETKRKLLTVIIENADTSSEMYDSALFRLIAEETLNTVEFPVIQFDISKEQGEISSKFSGEVRNGNERSQLRSIMSNTIEKLLNVVIGRMDAEAKQFMQELEKMKNTFADRLLENTEQNYEKILSQVKNKEIEVGKYEQIIEILEKII